MDFAKLEQKLIGAGIPSEIAKNCVLHYERGISPELSFENDELPSDDHFKTLSKMYKVFCKQFKDQPISEVTIKGFLLTPYSQIEAARKTISELFEKYSDKISELYENDIHIYDLRADEATYIYELISDYITDEEKLWQVFKKAAIVGEFYTDSRIEAVVDAVGKCLASEVIYESVVNGYLLYPYDTDPIEALKYLRTQFDAQTTAKIIIENPDYLYLYKDEFYVEFSWQKEKRELQMAEIIAKYNN